MRVSKLAHKMLFAWALFYFVDIIIKWIKNKNSTTSSTSRLVVPTLNDTNTNTIITVGDNSPKVRSPMMIVEQLRIGSEKILMHS